MHVPIEGLASVVVVPLDSLLVLLGDHTKTAEKTTDAKSSFTLPFHATHDNPEDLNFTITAHPRSGLAFLVTEQHRG